MPSDAAAPPTFTYRGQSFLWGYSSDRQSCGLWRADDPAGAAHQTWPISEHEAAWRVFRSLEPNATKYAEAQPTAPSKVIAQDAGPKPSLPTSQTSRMPSVSPASASWAVSNPALAHTPASVRSATVAAAAGAPEVSHSVKPRARLRTFAIVALISAAVVLAAVLCVRAFHSTPSPGSANPGTASPGQAVLTAAVNTEGLHTAEMSMTETVTAGSKTLTVPATGVVDFSTGSGSLSMTVEGQHFSVVSSDGALYMSIPQISQLLPGKTWVSVPIGSSGSAAGGALSGGDPAQMLQILASRGNTVVPLGSTSFGGVPVQSYSVSINKSAVEGALASSGLPASIVQGADQLLQSVGPINFKVYVDSADQLRGMDFSMSIPGNSGGTVSAQVTFSNFGAPAPVATPPASQVASLQQFLGAAEQAVGG